MNEMAALRLVRSTPEPLGLFLRPGHSDHRVLSQILSEGRAAMTGVIFDPTLVGPQEELRTEVRRRNLWAVLDTRFMELATPGGYTPRRAALPWAASSPHRPQHLSGASGRSAMAAVADFVGKYGFNAVLMGHYLERGAADTWLPIDLFLIDQFKRELRDRRLEDTALYYTVAVPTNVFHDASKRAELKSALESVEIDGLWLRVHPFGATSGHLTLQRFIQSCRDLHSLKLPLIVEKAGSIGLALLAFGAVSGIESGVSSGDKFDFGRLSHPPDNRRSFAAHARVYLPGLGVFLDRAAAEAFFGNRNLKAAYGCQNPACCRRGAQDTLADPRRHFVFTRMEEVGAISQVPSALRPMQYLDNALRPATDRLGRVLQASLPDDLKARLERERRKLDGWRHTLGELSRSQSGVVSEVMPVRRAVNRRGA
jgi:hypothetical protein